MLAAMPGSEHGRRRIYLLRHGAVDYFTPEGAPLPTATVPLSATGRAQARSVAAALAGVGFDRVVVSGALRSVETARIVVGPRGPRLEVVEDLTEIRGGRLADIPAAEVEPVFLGALGPGLTPESRFLGGETYGSLTSRVIPALRALIGEPGWTRLLLVLHGVVNRVILADLLGAGLDLLHALEQDCACVNVIDVGPGGAVVRLVNHTPWDPAKESAHDTTMEALLRAYRPAPDR
jgi:probable phosphoglycerate mutase